MLAYLIPIAVFGLMWVFLIRPQQRQLRERAQLVASVAVGHRIVTAGGIHGTVTEIGHDGDELQVEVAPGVVMTIDRRAVGRVLDLEERTTITDDDLDLDEDAS